MEESLLGEDRGRAAGLQFGTGDRLVHLAGEAGWVAARRDELLVGVNRHCRVVLALISWVKADLAYHIVKSHRLVRLQSLAESDEAVGVDVGNTVAGSEVERVEGQIGWDSFAAVGLAEVKEFKLQVVGNAVVNFEHRDTRVLALVWSNARSHEEVVEVKLGGRVFQVTD